MLVPAHDHDALAAALTRLLAEPETRRTLGSAGRARVQEFTAQRMASRFIDAVGPVI